MISSVRLSASARFCSNLLSSSLACVVGFSPGARRFEMVGQKIDHALIQIADHVGDLLMLALEILQLQSNRARRADFGPGDRVVIEDLKKKHRFFAVARAPVCRDPI